MKYALDKNILVLVPVYCGCLQILITQSLVAECAAAAGICEDAMNNSEFLIPPGKVYY